MFYKFCPFRAHGLNKEKHPTDMKNLCMKIREGRKRMAKTLVGRNKVSLPTYTCSSLWSGFDIIFLTGSIFIVEVAICLYGIFSLIKTYVLIHYCINVCFSAWNKWEHSFFWINTDSYKARFIWAF